MIEEGLFDKFNCDAVYGMHNMPGFDKGRFAIRTGPMLASSDSWEVTFKGTGGHGAMPDRGTDPTYVAAQFIVAVQGIIGRNVVSTQAAVLSVGHIHAGTPGSPNVIPSEVLIKGTARSFSRRRARPARAPAGRGRRRASPGRAAARRSRSTIAAIRR
jgi:hippurate hydrolase